MKRLRVKVLQTIQWEREVTLPRACPECKTRVQGFDAVEPAFGTVHYDSSGSPDGEMPEYFDDHVIEAKCNACGHVLFSGRELFLESPAAMRAAEEFSLALEDTEAGL